MRLHRRELAFLEASPRALLFTAGAVLLTCLAAYGGLYASVREAAYWAMAAPAMAGFASACALTSRDRESGLWRLMVSSPTPISTFLWTRWAASTAVGTAAGLAGAATLGAFSLLGVAPGAYALRLLLAVPFMAAAASAGGLVLGLALGSRGGQAGASAAMGVVIFLTAGMRGAAEAAGRLPEGSVARALLDALAAASPTFWGVRFAQGGGVQDILVLVAMAGAFGLAASRIERSQLPSGEYRSLATSTLLVAVAALLLPAAAHAVSDATPGLPEPPGGVALVVLLGDPPLDGEGNVAGPPREVRGGSFRASVALFLPPGATLTDVRVEVRGADGERDPRVVFEPSTFTAAELVGEEGEPAASWPVVVHVRGAATLDVSRMTGVAEVDAAETRATSAFLGPFVRKASSSAAELALLAVTATALIALTSVPYLARARRNRRRSAP